MIFASVGVILGQFALLVDLTNRIWGSHSRTLLGSSARIAFVLGASFLFGLPLYLIVFGLEAGLGRALLNPFGLVGAVLFVHYLFPYRLGIRRGADGCSEGSPKPLTKGVVLRKISAEVETMPDGLDKLVCLVCSDLHCNDSEKLELIRGAFDQLSKEDWDFVFVLGDLTSTSSFLAAAVEAATSVPSRFGTFCVRGNHDLEGGREPVLLELLEGEPATLLLDESRYLAEIETTVLGLEGPYRRKTPPPAVESGLAIGLTHTPDNIRRLGKLNVQVAVAGHSHGGMFRLPWLGPILLPARLGRFLVRGWFQYGKLKMFITTGMGTSPLKAGTIGEVVRLTITRLSRGDC